MMGDYNDLKTSFRISLKQGFRDSLPVRKLRVLIGYAEILSKTGRVGSGAQIKSSI